MPDNLQQLFEPYKEIVRFNEPMSKHTSFGIGGPAEIFITPRTIEETQEIYLLCQRNKLPVRALGNGTNLLVRDEGVKTVVIKQILTGLNFSGHYVEVEAGYSLAHLVRECLHQGLSGLEGLAGIPGSVGGAVAMNAGGKYGTIGKYISSIIALNRFGEEQFIDGSRITFGYRTSSLKNNPASPAGGFIILSITLKLAKGDPAELKKRFEDVLREKSETQPLGARSAGCAFKNPPEPNPSAGKLIDEAGLKGYTIGGAQVSDKHANFIINKGNGSANDILTLLKHIQKTVRTKSGIALEPEVEIW